MKLKNYFLLLAFLSPFYGMAQNNTFPTTGNVGIGTISPLMGTNNQGLHISRGNHSAIILGDPVNSNYGGVVQTTDNKHRVFIGANLYDDQTLGWKNFVPGLGGSGISIIADRSGWGTSINFYVSDQDVDTDTKMTIRGNGNVGIGTANPQAKLTVEGNILAKEIKVKTDISVPDYVFDSDYKMLSLTEIETYVKEHKHLPEIPSAKAISENGLNLAEMNLLLLKKVEELTLHLIREQASREELKEGYNERIDVLERKIEALNTKIKTLN